MFLSAVPSVQVLLPKRCTSDLSRPYVICRTHFFLDLITLVHGESINHEADHCAFFFSLLLISLRAKYSHHSYSQTLAMLISENTFCTLVI